MYTKVELYNLALQALLLTKTISDTDTDPSKENQTLNIHYKTALNSVLQDLDLDATSSQKTLELITADPNELWDFAYKYPTNCAFLRRIQSCVVKDVRSTQIAKRVTNHNGQKAIYTNQENAIAELITNDLPLSLLSASAALCVAYKLAILSAPLIAGKGAQSLRKQIMDMYVLAKAEAQEHDRLENNNFDEDWIESDLVQARLE